MASYDHSVWQELIEVARKEEKLVLASTPNPELRERIPRVFRERFGVEIEFIGGRSSDLTNRLQAERAAGLYTIDLVISGGDSGSLMFGNGWLDPIRPLLVVPEVAEASIWRDNRLPFLDPEEQFVFQLERAVFGTWIVNPQVVKESELRTLDDVLTPVWKGQISIDDPTVAGLGQNNAVYLYLERGEDFFRKLYVEQAPAVNRDDRQLEDWLGRGSHPITFGLARKNVEQMVQQGLPVKDLGLLDGRGWVRGPSIALLRNASHPNAARLFLNWIASPEGLRIHATAEQLPPMRKDMELLWAQGYSVPRTGVEYPMNADDFAFITETKPAIINRIKEIVGR